MLRKIIPLCILSAVMLALPFYSSIFSFLSWFAFVPVFFALKNTSKRLAFLILFVTGVIYWSGVIYWLAHVTLAGTIVLILYLALYFAAFGLIIRRFTRNSTIFSLLFIPSVWVLLEYTRSYLLTGFPWALLGYSQYLNLPVIQLADITGVWGVSYLLVLVNVAMVEIIWAAREGMRSRLRSVIIILVSVLIAVFSYGYFKIYNLRPIVYDLPLKVSVIQGNIPQELKWDERAMGSIVNKYSRMTEEAAKEKPDLIVWPEAASPGLFGQDDDVFDSFYALAKRIKVPILLGAVSRSKDIFFNSALLVDQNGQIFGRYDKLHLVPFGEYIPLKKYLPFLETVVPIGDIEKGRSYTVFKLPVTSYQLPVTFSVLICFEDLFPELSREFTKRGAGFLVNITNDAWYKLTAAPYQHLQASVFRAVENRRFLVRSANTGVSGFIAPSGKIISLAGDGSGKHIFVDGIDTQTIGVFSVRPGIYTRYGDWFVSVCLIFVLYGLMRRLRSIPTAKSPDSHIRRDGRG